MMTYDISMGVRKSDIALASEVNQALASRRDEVDSILRAYGVPQMHSATGTGVLR
jgi:mxaJ protein